MQHALWPLLKPASVAVLGATERQHALGRVVYANLRDGGFRGTLYPVNLKRASVFGERAWRSLAAIGVPVDLAVIGVPARAVHGILDDGRAAGLKSALMLTGAPDGDAASMRRWNAEVVAHARECGIRLVGPRAFGLVRTDIALNATFSPLPPLAGGLAVVSQSGAVCTALLDFATPLGIGFSSVVAVGEERDVDIAEVIEALLLDPATDAILTYVEAVGDARGFLSALRAAARVKPVVVLKAGRSAQAPDGTMSPSADEVFSVAIRRAGAVRVQTYTQLFAAARALAMGRIPRGDRLAILANGRGPALMAADRAVELGMHLATFAPATIERLARALPAGSTLDNPLDLRGDATGERYAAALAAVLADDGVDAAAVLQVPRPAESPVQAARAVANVAQRERKPVLGAWLGAVERREIREALEAGGVANFYTPENAVEGFAFLASYRRSQSSLLEVPGWKAEAQRPDLAAAAAIHAANITRGPVSLDAASAAALLHAFDITVDSFATRATTGIELAVGVHRDAVFGPVITLGGGDRFPFAPLASALPPLNDRLAADLINDSAARVVLERGDCPRASLLRLLLQVSALVTALPWVRALRLDPVVVADDGVVVRAAAIDIDDGEKGGAGYSHMAIHPYPADLAGDATLGDGAIVHVRPIRPEDAALEQRFIASLSKQTRYFRFFYGLHELTPQMLVRFTQVDYDRELALVALATDADAPGGHSFAGIARYIRNPDRVSAEFAVVIADAWQRRGLGRALMHRLMSAARGQGIELLEGTVLRENQGMLRFMATLGFALRADSGEGDQVIVERNLQHLVG